MNNKVSSVLNSIEKIDNLIMEADVSVSDAMSDVYSKQFKMEGNVTEDYINHEYYQESVIAGILIGGGIIAVLATAIVLITKHVKKSASGDPEKKNDTSTAAGTALDNQEELKKKVEQIKGELDKAGGSVEITNNGINTTELNKKFELVTKLCDSAEGFLKEKEDDLIKQEIENFTKQLEEINNIQYKSSETVTVSADSLTKIIDLAAPIKTMNDKLTKTAEELTKRSKENKNKSDSETDSDKKEKYNELKEGLERISKDSTQLSKDLTDDLNAIRSYMDAVLKAAKEKAKPSETESEKSQETPQNPDILKQKIYPITAKWASTPSNSDSNHPGAKLTADEAYNIIDSIHDNVVNHRGPIALNTLKAKANEDPTKAMLIKNLIEATINNKEVFDTEDEETINEIKSGLPELETIAANAPSEEPKKDETKPESEEPKEGTNESGEKITISKDGGALYDLITSWSDIEKFKSVLKAGNAVISGPINVSYNNESLLTNTGKTKGTSTKFEITFGSEEEKRLISSFLNILDNFLNNEELFNKIPPELQKKLIGAFDMFLKRNEPLFPGNINLENNNFGWLDIKNSINKLKEKYAGSKETSDTQTDEEPKTDEPKADETKSGETTNTPPVENKEGNTEQLSENEQKMQVAFEQLESKLEQIQQKYPNGLSTIGIATGCDPRTFSGVILTQFIENKSEAEIKKFSNNLMDCLIGGFFRNTSQTHAKANSQLPAPCKEAIDAMQSMINDGYEVGNSLMGTNYTPDNLSKYKGYMYKGNLINKLMKITPENVLTDDVFNEVKLGNPTLKDNNLMDSLSTITKSPAEILDAVIQNNPNYKKYENDQYAINKIIPELSKMRYDQLVQTVQAFTPPDDDPIKSSLLRDIAKEIAKEQGWTDKIDNIKLSDENEKRVNEYLRANKIQLTDDTMNNIATAIYKKRRTEGKQIINDETDFIKDIINTMKNQGINPALSRKYSQLRTKIQSDASLTDSAKHMAELMHDTAVYYGNLIGEKGVIMPIPADLTMASQTKSDDTDTKSLPTVSELINDVDNVDKVVEAYNQTASPSDKIDSGDISSFKNAQNQIKIDNLEDVFNEFIKIYNIDLNMPISKSVFKTLASVSEDVNSCHGFESNLNDSFLSIRYEKYQNDPSRKQQMFDEAKTYAEMRGINVTLTKPDGTQVEVGTKSDVKNKESDSKNQSSESRLSFIKTDTERAINEANQLNEPGVELITDNEAKALLNTNYDTWGFIEYYIYKQNEKLTKDPLNNLRFTRRLVKQLAQMVYRANKMEAMRHDLKGYLMNMYSKYTDPKAKQRIYDEACTFVKYYPSLTAEVIDPDGNVEILNDPNEDWNV